MLFFCKDRSGHKTVIASGDAFSVVKSGVVDCHRFFLSSAALICTHLNIIMFFIPTELTPI